VCKITALGLGRDEKGTTTKKKDYKHVYINYKGVMREGTALFNKREVRMYYCLHCAHDKDTIFFIRNCKDCISTSYYEGLDSKR
jgi:hypothetical protein